MRPAADRSRRRPRATPPAGSGRGGAIRERLRPAAWLVRHAEALLSSLGRLTRSPLATLMTVAVIGIALALPAGLYLLLDNARTLSAGWDGTPRVSLFLRRDVAGETAARLATRLARREEIAEARLIPRDAALEEFRRLSGFGDAIDALERNPLPDVIVVRPAAAYAGPGAVAALADELAVTPYVERAQLDLQWVQRLYALMEIVRRGVLVIAVLLGLAVLLIVGNTIRLDIQNRRREIEVSKLIGATDAFVRRPFLYSGAWYGLLGGLAAWLLVTVALAAVAGPAGRLAALYESPYRLAGAGAEAVLSLLVGGALLGLLGAWLAVGRHLRAIEPQ